MFLSLSQSLSEQSLAFLPAVQVPVVILPLCYTWGQRGAASFPAELNPAWATETQRWGGDTQSMQPPRGRFPGLDTSPWLSGAAGRAGPAASPGLLWLLGCLVSRER